MSDAHFSQGGGNTEPTYHGDRAAMWREIRKLWKIVGQKSNTVIPPQEKAWSYSGIVAPAENIAGQVWVTPANLFISNMQLTLQVAATVDYVVLLIVDGVFRGGATIPAGFTNWLTPQGVEVSKGKEVYLQLMTQAGGDGEMLGMVLRWETLNR